MIKTLSHFATVEDFHNWIETRKKQLRQGGTLEKYVIDTTTYYPYVVAFGYAHGDNCWREGFYFITSTIDYIGDGFILTRNTHYKLGEPAEGDS